MLTGSLYGPPTQPGGWGSWAQTDDLDQVRSLISDRCAPPGAVSAGAAGPLAYQHRIAAGRTLALKQAATGLPWTVRGRLGATVLYLQAPAGSRYRVGRRELAPTPGAMAMLPSQLEFTRHSPAGHFLAARIDEAVLLGELGARQGQPEMRRIVAPQLILLQPDGPARAGLLDATSLFLASTAARSEAALVLAEARLVARVVDACSAQLLAQTGARVGRVTAARLAALEAWIEAHLGDPLTLGSLCAQAQVSARSLQAAFQARRGMSPVRYVLERRLARAQERLARALPGDSVTTVALDCGFDHMSRFAQAYRQLFGERPSQTLARSAGLYPGHAGASHPQGRALMAAVQTGP
jgi:AraC-like DNA-binding protein